MHLVLPDVVRLGRQQQEDEEPLEVRLEGEGLRVLPVQRPGPLAQYCALGGGIGAGGSVTGAVIDFGAGGGSGAEGS